MKFFNLFQQIEQSEYIRDIPITPYFHLHSGIYFGIILMLILINIFFFFNLKDKIYLYYVFLVASTNFVLAYHEGLLRPFVKNMYYKYDVDMISHMVQLTAGFLFFNNFVKLKFHLPKTHKIFQYLLLLTIFIYLGYFINFSHSWIKWGDNFGVVFFFSIWILSFFMFKIEPYAKLMALGFGVVVIAAFFHITLGGIQKIPVFGDSTNIFKTGAILEAIILTYATTFKTRKIREENDEMRFELDKYINQILLLEGIIKTKESSKDEVDTKIISLVKKYDLSDREADILHHILLGYKNAEIAEKLFISTNTVKYHIKNLYVKLDVSKRAEISSKLIFD